MIKPLFWRIGAYAVLPALPKPLDENNVPERLAAGRSHDAMKAGRVRSGQFLSGPVHNLRLARRDE
jgi:hypothetical protein